MIRRPGLRTFVRGAAGTLVSVACLALALQGIDLAGTLAVLGAAVPGWLALALVAIAADILVRGRRWQILIAPIHRVPYPRLLGYLLVGYLGNNVLPLRLGELVRSHYLGDREGVSRTTTLGTVVVERVVDTAVLVAIAALAILVLNVRGVVASAVLVGLALTALLTIGLAVAVLAHRLPGADRARRLVHRAPKLDETLRKLRGGLAVAGRPVVMAEAVLLSALAWGCTVLAFAAAGQAVGIELTLSEAALLAAGANLATAIPSGPGYLGTFELAVVKIAAAFGIAASTALALAVAVHALILVLTSVGGGAALIHFGWRTSSVANARVAVRGE